MSGFVGRMIDSTTNPLTPSDNMGEEIHHRGSDGDGTYMDEYIQLNFRHLNMKGLDQGHQPMSDDSDRFTIVFNGEIYNHKELRMALEKEGMTFKTASDTEVLLALYIAKKEQALHQLRGTFAFVIWDKQEKSLFAARDHFGIKPLYYTLTEEGMAFASEQKSLLKAENRTIDSQALHNYLTFQFVPGEQRLFENIEELKPGHYMINKLGEDPIFFEYNHLGFYPNKRQSFDESVRKTREVLEDAVQKHMQGDVSIGAFLSGGIDSTSIVALAKQHHPSIKTFTVGFERDGYSEIDLARETADFLGVENIHKIITPDEIIKELPNIVWHMDDPVADPAAIPNYFVAKEASKHVKVVLSGEGADELFGGYNIYREPIALKMFDYLPGFLKNMLHRLALILPEGLKGKSYLLRGTTPLAERYVGNAKIFDEEEKERLLIDYNQKFKYSNMTKKLYHAAAHNDPTTQMQYIDLHTWLRGDILTVADRMTMAHSLDIRVPFLDKEVFEVARTLPLKAKIANGTTKYVLRQAVKDLVPDTVVDRKKLGFPVPVRHWLKNEFYEWTKDTIKNSPVDHLLNKEEIWKLLDQHVNDKYDHSRKIWTVLIFMVWYDVYVERSEEGQRLRSNM